MNSKAQKLLTVDFVLFIVAAAIAGYMTYHHYELLNGAMLKSFCSISEKVDCDAVNSSEYSAVAGVPLAVFALAYYLLAAVLSLFGARSAYLRRDALAVLAPLSLVSVLVSIGTFALSFFVLGKVCLMCGSLQTINVVTCVLTLLAARDQLSGSSVSTELAKVNGKRALGFLVLGAVGLAAVHGITYQLKEDRFPLEDPEKYVNEFRSQPVRTIDLGDSPRQGVPGDNPPVRIIEFADFQCPACGMAAQQMHRLMQLYGDKVQLIFKNFPLDSTCNPLLKMPVHPHACIAAKAALCAKKQGKWKEMYEQLFTHQREINHDNILAWAREMGLDTKALEDCIPSQDIEMELRKDIDEAAKADLESTPTFFVAGRMVKGIIDEKRLKLLLRELGQ